MSDVLNLLGDHLVRIRWWCSGHFHIGRKRLTRSMHLPYLLAFLDVMVSASDEVLPCLSNDASVVEIGRMVD